MQVPWRDAMLKPRQVTVNGAAREIAVAPGTPLLEVLRDTLGLTGTKEACGRGECGACTVLIDGQPVMSCMSLIEDVRGPVTTIEGIAEDHLDLRVAFADCGAFQCGFCTPGQIVRAAALLREPWPENAGDVEAFVHTAMSGNICRCTGYTGIVDAVMRTGANRGKLNGGVL